ncbi:MAG: OmpA family protein [Chloroflexota bacterium]
MSKISFFVILLAAALAAGCGASRPRGYALTEESDEFDSSATGIYITSTLPIDSADASKLVFDFFRLETKEYPENIRIFARVYDSSGHFITNMADPYRAPGAPNYFSSIREDLGKVYNTRSEQVNPFKVREYGAKDSIPYNIVLTIDYSGSMAGVMDAIYEGTELFVNMKMDFDQIGITTFNQNVDRKVPMNSDKRSIINLYRAKRDKGFGQFSAVFDAVADAVSQFGPTIDSVPRVLVLFSDGDENYSKTKIGELIDQAKKEDVHIFAVGFGYSQDENLKYMAQYTGGKFYKARSKQELIAVFRDIYMSLRYYYLITYDPPNYWGYHKVNAYLKHPARADSLLATGEYETSGLMPWDSIGRAFTRPILFDYNEATLKPESLPIIDEIVDALLSAPRLKLEIQGHTDDIGGIEFNMRLSEARAQAVMNALIDRGIDPKRLRSRGFGFSKPIAPNTDEAGRGKNRRTEFVVIAK